MSEDNKQWSLRGLFRRGPKDVPVSPVVPPMQAPDGGEAAMAATEVSNRIFQKGIRLREEFFKRGCTTDDPDVLELFELTQELASRAIVSLDMQDAPFRSSLESMYSQIKGTQGNPSFGEMVNELQKNRGYALAITINKASREKIEASEEGRRQAAIFEGFVRGLVQSHDVPVCVYTGAGVVVPSELARNLPTVSSPRPKA